MGERTINPTHQMHPLVCQMHTNNWIPRNFGPDRLQTKEQCHCTSHDSWALPDYLHSSKIGGGCVPVSVGQMEISSDWFKIYAIQTKDRARGQICWAWSILGFVIQFCTDGWSLILQQFYAHWRRTFWKQDGVLRKSVTEQPIRYPITHMP